LRKIVAILLVTIMMASVFVGEVEAVEVRFDGELFKPGTWSMHITITPDELARYKPKLFKLIPLQATPGAFSDIDIEAVGWTYATDGQSYLSLIAPAPITTTGDIYIGGFASVYNATTDYSQFTWQAFDASGALVDSGSVLPWQSVGGVVLSVDKFSLMTPYIGLASAWIIGAVAAAVYVKRIKRRKEKQ